jgi:hypothetical protein
VSPENNASHRLYIFFTNDIYRKGMIHGLVI